MTTLRTQVSPREQLHKRLVFLSDLLMVYFVSLLQLTSTRCGVTYRRVEADMAEISSGRASSGSEHNGSVHGGSLHGGSLYGGAAYWPLLLLIIFLLSSTCVAESIKIAGVSLPATEVERAEGDLYRIAVSGEERIVREELIAVTALSLLSVTDRQRIRDEDLWKILRELLIKDQMREASRIILFFDKREQFLQKLISLRVDSIREAIKRTFSLKSIATTSSDFRAKLVLFLGMKGDSWITLEGVSQVFVVEKQLQKLAEDYFYSTLLGGSVESAQEVLQAVELIFGSNAKSYQKLSAEYDKYVEISDLIERGDVERVVSRLDSIPRASEVRRVLYSRYVSKLHALTEDFLHKNDLSSAMKQLRRVPLKRRTPTTHDLTKRVLRASSPESIEPFLAVRSHLFLTSIGGHDEQISALHQDLLGRAAREAYSNDNLSLLHSTMKRLESLPNVSERLVTKTRVLLVHGLLAEGNVAEARALITDINSVSLLDRTLFVFKGLFIPVWIVILLCMAPIVAAFSVYIFKYIQLRRYGYAGRRYDTSREEEFVGGGFAVRQRMEVNSIEKDEYLHGLRELGLNIGASQNQIKAAYRRVIKDYHPDTRTSESKEMDEKFITMTQLYERTLELHKTFQIQEGALDIKASKL